MSRTVVADVWRDRELASHRYTSRADLFGFTDYLLEVSDVLNCVNICDISDVTELHHVNTLGICVLDIIPNIQNFFAILEFLLNPFDNLPWNQIEGYLIEPPHVRSTVPFFSWLWRDSLVPRLYHLLSASWPETRLK